MDCGRRSGKSLLSCEILVSHLLDEIPGCPRPLYICGAPVQHQANEIFWDLLLDLIPDEWIDGGKKGDNVRLSDPRTITLANNARITIAGLDKPHRIEGKYINGFVGSEWSDCFIAGTMVDTLNGPCPIEQVLPGDLVFNASGTGVVEAVTQRHKISVAKVCCEDGYSTVCSITHKFFTQRGWVEAQHLCKGDYLVSTTQAMRILRRADDRGSPEESMFQKVCQRSVSKKTRDTENLRSLQTTLSYNATILRKAVLRNILLSEVEDVTAGTLFQGSQRQSPSKDGRNKAETSCLRCRSDRNSQEGPRRQSSYAQSGSLQESQRNEETVGIELGRESLERWAGVHTPADDFGCSRSRLCEGTTVVSAGIQTLFDRHSSQAQETGDRGGRAEPYVSGQEGTGSEEGRVIEGAWVDSVEIYESGSPEFLALSSGKDTITLYDLTVSGHPSFSVDGLLVHNCKPGTFDRTIRPMLSDYHGWYILEGVPKRQGIGASWYRNLCERVTATEERRRQGLPPSDEDYPDCIRRTWPAWDIMDPAEVEEARRTMSPEDFEEQYGAKWTNIGGSVWTQFNREFNVRPCEHRNNLPIVCGQDFNNTPMSWTLSHKVGDFFETFDEMVVNNTNTAQMMNMLWSKWGHHKGGWQFYGDASGKKHTTNSPVSDYAIVANHEQFKMAGRTMHYPPANPNRRDRFAAANARLCTADGIRHAFIDPKCIKLIEDMQMRSYTPGTMLLPKNEGMLGHISDSWSYPIFKLWRIGFDVGKGSNRVYITDGPSLEYPKETHIKTPTELLAGLQ